MTKQTLITIIITGLIGFGLGYSFAPTDETDTFQAGWDAAKQRLEESGFYPMIEDMEITSVSGTVEEVKDNKISLKIYPLEPLADPELDNRVIEVDEKTEIYQLVQRDQAEYQRELEEFNKKMQEQMENPEAMAEMTEPVMPPEMSLKQEISLTDIQVGQQISVRADEDIKDTKQFKAIEITVQFMP